MGLVPKSMSGKKWLKRIVFGGLVKMLAEIGPPISRNEDVMAAKRRKNRKNGKNLYRVRYVEPDRIPSDEANMHHKVIYCVATLDPQITPVRSPGPTPVPSAGATGQAG